VQQSTSCWASPLHMMRKADGGWRPCGDFRQLNLITEPDQYPLPRLDDLVGRLKGCKIFSKLDLKQGYYQIPMSSAYISKTAIITPVKLLCMPFGLRNAGQSYQWMMDQVLERVPAAYRYVEGILLAWPNHHKRKEDLGCLLIALREYGLVLIIEKCSFAQSAVDFLGHLITAEGASPLESHVAAVQNYPQPATV
jgi:hypothetical protein